MERERVVNMSSDEMAAALAQANQAIEDLQVRNAFLERSLDELDQVVRGLNLEVQRLHREVIQLWEQQSQDAPGGRRPDRLEDEVPPHY
jgi:SlyX.